MTEPQPVTDEQLAAWKALAETARTEAWQFTSPILRNAVPALIAEVERLRAVVAAMEWRPIETAPRGVNVIRYEPEERNRHGRESLHARIIISSGTYPRLASHWMPLPAPPQEKDHG